jgi:exonuclease V gamma subunit
MTGVPAQAQTERDCQDLVAALAQAWRAMREAQRALHDPDPAPFSVFAADQLLERAIAEARQVLDRTSQSPAPRALDPVRGGFAL